MAPRPSALSGLNGTLGLNVALLQVTSLGLSCPRLSRGAVSLGEPLMGLLGNNSET